MQMEAQAVKSVVENGNTVQNILSGGRYCRRAGTGAAVYMSIQNLLFIAKICTIENDNTIQSVTWDWLKPTVLEANTTSNTYFSNSTLQPHNFRIFRIGVIDITCSN
uniref:Uncharacterized protein n=1 Tax=Glossina pallidipes TaxID=7398 RepID=A0A1A9ZSL5_GLOPL